MLTENELRYIVDLEPSTIQYVKLFLDYLFCIYEVNTMTTPGQNSSISVGLGIKSKQTFHTLVRYMPLHNYS